MGESKPRVSARGLGSILDSHQPGLLVAAIRAATRILFSLCGLSRNRQSWTPQDILERGLDMLTFLEQRRRVSLGSRTEKVRLLNLEFLEPPDA